LALLDPATGFLLGNPRPISLKNRSIDIVAAFEGVTVGERYVDTRKGTVSHASVPAASIRDAEKPARCRWVVFPKFVSGSAGHVDEICRAEAFALISEQSFNRERMGESGFRALCSMLDACRCYAIEYGDTRTALDLVGRICEPGA